jgi:hypothetical protein
MAQIIDLGKIRFNWAGTYNPATQYSFNDIVTYGPNLYAFTALNAATGLTPSTNPGSWTLINQGINYRGVYASATHYYVNDIVVDNTNTYIVITEHTSVSNVASGNANLNLIAAGQAGIPSQSGKLNSVLTTDGSALSWSQDLLLDKLYVDSITKGATAKGYVTTAFNGATLTDTMSVFAIDSSADNSFGQFAIVNAGYGSNVSTDFIAYSSSGNNDHGWVDMGITSYNFDEAVFGITGPGDTYLFGSHPVFNQSTPITYSVTGGVATVTTSYPHGYSSGNTIVILYTGVSGIDGTHAITAVPTSTTFQFATSHATVGSTSISPSLEAIVTRPVGAGNLVIATDGTGTLNAIVFAAGGYNSGTTQMTILPNQTVNVSISTAATSATTGALTVSGGVGIVGSSWTNGDVHIGGVVYSGDTTATAWGITQLLTAPAAIFEVTSPANTYGQFALHNKNASSSVDFIAYPDNGNDSHGWIDMGMTGSTFNSATYGITGPNDGYLFVDAPAVTPASGNGNLVLATGSNGAQNAIVFAAGGFVSGTSQMIITPNHSVAINIATPSTSPLTGALTVAGGVGILGDVHIQGSITFGGSGTQVTSANLAVNAPMVFAGSGSTTQSYDLGLVAEGKYNIANYDPNTNPIGIPTVTVINKQISSNVATLLTATAHNFAVGDVVVVASVDTTFNGTWTITQVPNSTSFAYAVTHADVASTPIGQNQFTINQASVASNVATIQTTASHTFVVGNTVVVAGVSNALFNGTFTITAVTSNTFSYALTSINITAFTTTGTATVNTSVSTATVTTAIRTRWSAIDKVMTSVGQAATWYNYQSEVQGTWVYATNISTIPTTNLNFAQATYGTPDVIYDGIKTGSHILQSGSFVLQGDIKAPAWTTNGIRHVGIPATFTDLTSVGTVNAAYTNVFGGNTIAAKNAVTYTTYAAIHVGAATAGTNVTITNNYAALFAGTVAFQNGLQVQGILDLGLAREIVNAGSTATTTSGNTAYTLDWSTANVFWNKTAPAGTSIEYDLINVPSTNRTDALGNQASGYSVMTVDIFQQQGATPYYPATVKINGSSATVRWAGGINPTLTTANGIDVFSFTLLYTPGSGTNPGTFTVLATVSAGY